MSFRLGVMLVISVMMTCLASHAQTPPYMWDGCFGEANDQFAAQLATDAYGNLALTGTFSNEVNFGGGTLSAGYFKDVYVVKFDHAGNHIWSYQFGDTAQDQGGQSVAIDPWGGVVLAGDFRGSIDFGGGSMTSAGGQDIFLVKLSKDGAYEWGRPFGDWKNEWVAATTTDAAGNVFFVGGFEGNIEFGGGQLACVGDIYDSDIFVAKFDGAGLHKWSARYGSAGYEEICDVTVDTRGDVLLTGYFQETVDFGGGMLVSAGGMDIFVAKLTSNGEHIWSQRFGDMSNQIAKSLTSDSSGNVILAGTFEGSLDFGGGTLESQGGYDIFLAKLNPEGAHDWSHSFGDEALWRQEANDVAVDLDDNILVTGEFEGTVDFGGGPLVNVGASDLFCAKFDRDGNQVWSRGYGDSHATDYHVAYSVCPDPWGNAAFAGHFSGELYFGPQPLLSYGNWDIFLVKLIPTDDPTAIRDMSKGNPPLMTAVPNPFNPNTQIRYWVPSRSMTRLIIYDAEGRRVRTLVDTPKPAGLHAVVWDGRNDCGNAIASGVFFARLETGHSVRVRKLVLLK